MNKINAPAYSYFHGQVSDLEKGDHFVDGDYATWTVIAKFICLHVVKIYAINCNGQFSKIFVFGKEVVL